MADSLTGDLPDPSRRRILRAAAAAGVGSAVFGRALAALAADEGRVTAAMIREAEWISGLELDDEKRQLMLEGMDELLAGLAELRAVPLDNGVPPALRFSPGAPAQAAAESGAPTHPPTPAAGGGPRSDEDLAWAPLTELSSLLRSRELSSLELTRLYLDRIERYDPLLRCVITRTEKLALEQAERADREIGRGEWRGPLHGVPWGAKDLMAVPGYPTTWGAQPYREQTRPERAAVAESLERAGAVLLAKTSVGALAWGDVWFDAKTRNPWDPEEGSSGSSAGSAAAVAAGLAGFALGTETWGSIVSPCTRCGVTGLRPTFGRVSRFGVMALSWSMDKVGPIARAAEDCALVYDAIRGADPRDPDAVDGSFAWPPRRDPRGLTIGYLAAQFDEDRAAEVEDEDDRQALAEWQEIDRGTLAALRGLGLRLVPLDLGLEYPIEPLSLILTAEAATAFDGLTRSGNDALLVRQEARAWPNVFRQGQMIPAVEYLRANRIRTLVQRRMAAAMTAVDLYVSPTFGGHNLLLTNLTGHPQVVLPNGFRGDGTPTSITLTGRLDGEAELLAVARLFQQATDFHRRRPPLERFLAATTRESPSA